MNQTVITACAFLILISCQYGYADPIKTPHKGEIKTQINLQSLISVPPHRQPAHLDPSPFIIKKDRLQEEDPFMMSHKDRWEFILSKTHPYKAKFQHDRDKYRQKSRLIQ